MKKKYFVVRLSGGLGNQLFQYATAFASANAVDGELLIDERSFEDYKLRELLIWRLKISARPANRQELQRWGKYPLKISRIFKRPFFSSNWVNEDKFGTTEITDKQSDWTYLTGYFQNQDFFANHKEALRAQFTPKEERPAHVDELVRRIKEKPSLSIHIRRGDYTIAKNMKIHGTCSNEYYKNAMGRVFETYSPENILVFSDDKEWVLENMSFLSEAIFVEGNEKNPYWDIFLMSLCDYHIIANSSFSWWGAWLAESKMTIAPTPWFADENMDGSKVTPKNWILLER